MYLKMRTFRGIDKMRKLKKLIPRYMRMYVITKKIKVIAYRLDMP